MVSSETNKNVYVCDGVQTVFPITFDVALDDYGNAEGIAVSLQDTVGTVTVLTKETHYTVSGKNLTTIATYLADYKIAIYRKNAILQQIGFVKNGKADLDVLEKLLDRIIFHIQEHEEKLGRTFLAPVTQSLIENINEALQVLINGNPDAFLTTLGVTDFVKTLLDDETASAALSTLGFTAYAKTLIAAASAGDAQTVLGMSVFIKSLLDDTDAETARNTLSVYSKAETGWTVESATEDKAITSSAPKYMLVFTRQATAKTITLPNAGNAGRTIRIIVAGSGAGDVSLSNADAATVGGFAVGNWKWDGTGSLTIIDDGTNWQIGEAGIWDTYYETYETNYSIPQDKYTHGQIIRRGMRVSSVTQAQLASTLNVHLPNLYDYARFYSIRKGVSGGTYMHSIARRTNASYVTIQGESTGGTDVTVTVNDDGTSGTWATDTYELDWETVNTLWTT